MFQCDSCKKAPFCDGFIYKKLILPFAEREIKEANDAFHKGTGLDYLHMDIVCDRYEPYPPLNVKPAKPSVKILPVPFIFIDERGKNS